ncbi:hypothetical protein AOQ84DRAFT_129010 [Glonium stellatum]|uniref:Uncharacterized protein n=1 Tax=Glonium stellatum TaxID=574774 RepID=A0A8E2F9F7_9PEZI|nr:hypothetical protein AOQ84DRAFT_129010 [Glonium stellatum]
MLFYHLPTVCPARESGAPNYVPERPNCCKGRRASSQCAQHGTTHSTTQRKSARHGATDCRDMLRKVPADCLLVSTENRHCARKLCDSGPVLEIFVGVDDARWPVRHASMHDSLQTGKLLSQGGQRANVSDLSSPCSIDKCRPVEEARERYWLGSKNVVPSTEQSPHNRPNAIQL